MKKIYLFAASVFFMGTAVFAQTETKTLTSHFASALTNPQNPQIGAYVWQGGDGYVSGSNAYGDQAVVQKFDGTLGVNASGSIDVLQAYIPVIANGSGNGTIKLAVWENVNGNIGNLIAESDAISLSDIDTTQAGLTPIYNSTQTAIEGAYNVTANFSNANIPANLSFFAGVILPTTITAGDTAVVLTTKTGFQTTPGYAGSIDATGAFDEWTQYDITVALAVFPTITTTTVGINDVLASQTKLYPNPANDVVTIEFNSNNVVNVNIVNLNGQVVANGIVNNGTTTVNVANLESGIYMYQAVDAMDNVVATNKFVKN